MIQTKCNISHLTDAVVGTEKAASPRISWLHLFKLCVNESDERRLLSTGKNTPGFFSNEKQLETAEEMNQKTT